ncbi:MAG: hypothetical protein Q4F05_03375 [bacterium]|nr:hypothetical protein [bacterium]
MRYELRKMWGRWEVLLVLLAACLFLYAYTESTLPALYEETKFIMDAYEGTMNEEWKEKVTKTYDKVIGDGSRISDRELQTNLDYVVLRNAYYFTSFDQNVDRTVATLQAQLKLEGHSGQLDDVESTYSNLKAHSDQLVYGYGMGYYMFLDAITILARVFLVVMIFLCVDVFTREKETDMKEMILTMKQGKKELSRRKFNCCILSGGFIYLVLLAVVLVTIYNRTGFEGGNTCIQDFLENFCPYMWDSKKYTVIVCIFSFLASIVCSAVIATIARYSKSMIQSGVVMVTFLLVPMFFKLKLFHISIYYWFSKFLTPEYFFISYERTSIGRICFSNWIIAAGILIALSIATISLAWRKERRELL